jgi:hypothetical protein
MTAAESAITLLAREIELVISGNPTLGRALMVLAIAAGAFLLGWSLRGRRLAADRHVIPATRTHLFSVVVVPPTVSSRPAESTKATDPR